MQSRVLLVSNRLPVTLTRGEHGLEVNPSVGGLASALKSVHSSGDSLWFGWSGLVSDAPEPEVAAALAP